MLGANRRTVAITGAFGFIGCRLLTVLREHPHLRLRAFDAREAPPQLEADIHVISGRVEDARTVREAVSGAEVVIHLAAIVQPDYEDVDSLRRVNVEGTRNVYTAALEAGCTLFVHMSSAGIYGPPSGRHAHHEGDDPAPETPYQRSKWEAEEALGAIEPGEMCLNILRPAGIYGPGSVLELPEYRRIRDRRLVLELPGDVIVHPTHVDDIVNAVRAVVDDPARHGVVFNIGGERAIRLQQLRALVAELMGVRRTRIGVPAWLARPLAALAEPILARRGPARPLLREISRGHLFSAAVDDRRFRERYPGVAVVELERGLRDHLAWARASGLL